MCNDNIKMSINIDSLGVERDSVLLQAPAMSAVPHAIVPDGILGTAQSSVRPLSIDSALGSGRWTDVDYIPGSKVDDHRVNCA